MDNSEIATAHTDSSIAMTRDKTDIGLLTRVQSNLAKGRIGASCNSLQESNNTHCIREEVR